MSTQVSGGEVTDLSLPRRKRDALLAHRGIWMALLLLGALAAAASYVDSYLAYVATSWVIFGLLGLSLDLIWGRAGVLSLGQTAFFGIGGYLGSVAAINLAPLTGNTLIWSGPVGSLAGACIAGLVGWLIFFGRMGALQATILTYTVTLIIWTSAVSFHATVGVAVIGGDNGLAEIPPYVVGFGNAAAPLSPNGMLACTILIAGGAYLLSASLMRSPFGLLVDCVRLNAEKTELLGYDTRKIQFWLFVLAGGIAGLAGALFGHWANYLTPSVFSVQEGLLVPIYVLVGGRGTLAGPFVGALLVGGLSFWLGGGVIGGQTTLVMGLGLMVLVLFVDGGVNGVGKTTLMRYAMGLCRQVAGEVYLDGVPLPQSTSRRARLGLGYVPQGRRVFPRLTVAENIAAAAVACGHKPHDGIARVFREFPMLRQKADALAVTLSGGQQQVLAIGRSLATQPKVLLLDEPTEGIQPSIIDEIAGSLLHLNRQTGLALLIAEQNLDFCLSLAQKAYVMSGGTVARTVTTDQLRTDKALLHEMLSV